LQGHCYSLEHQWYHVKKITLVSVQRHILLAAEVAQVIIPFTLITKTAKEQKTDVMKIQNQGVIFGGITA